MSQKSLEFLLKTFLFSSLLREDAMNILSKLSFEVKTFGHGESIYTPHQYEKKIGFVMSGECVINKLKSDGSLVPLNTIKEGDSFGILAVLSVEEEYPTQIISSRASKILFINQEDFLSIIKKHPDVSMNVISFLTKKISFLNRKISTFASDNVEQKLASYIVLEFKKNLKKEFSFNCKKTAESLNVGRASLYRAINSLTEAGLISLNNKKIYILDLIGLERI